MKFHRVFLLILMTGVAACASSSQVERPLITIDQLIASTETYEGTVVTVDACLFVTHHGMSLYNCQYQRGKPGQLVGFEPLPGVGDRAYSRLVSLGHEGFAVPKFEIRAEITGVYIYRESSGQSRELLIMDTRSVKKLPEDSRDGR
jgi:hypothetical protein